MRRTRKLFGAACAVAAVAMMIPAGASALTIPGVPPGTIPPGTIPPEVDAALSDALAETITTLVAADFSGLGIAKHNAAPGNSDAAAVDLPGVVTVGKAATTKDSSKVTVLSVGGQDLLVRNGDVNGGTYSGELAPAGDLVDDINAALCPNGTAAGNSCTMLLYSSAKDTKGPTTGGFVKTQTDTHAASFKLVKVQVASSPEGLEILPVSSTTAKTTITVGSAVQPARCTDFTTAFLVTGSGSLALASVVGLGHAIKTSILKPCPTP